MRHLYSALFFILLPLIFFKLLLRSRKSPLYRQRWLERIGQFEAPKFKTKPIWFHTVSVGEFIAAKPLIQHFVDQANTEVVVTTGTPTGSEQVQKQFGESVFHVYCPYDLPFFVQAFLSRVKPRSCILFETELWPNIIHQCHVKDIPVVLANGRLSEKSAASYNRFHSLSREMLNKLSSAAIQHKEDGERFVQLGLAPEKLSVIGSVKFDLEISDYLRQRATKLKQELSVKGKRPIWIAASTHKGEDEIILNTFARLKERYPTLRLILVPRHPERFDFVFKLSQAGGFQCIRRSEHLSSTPEEFDVLVGDTMGELLLLLGTADVAFIGGSFVNNGGHNYIEAAAWGIPILSGPSTYNFQNIAKQLINTGALEIVSNETTLNAAVSRRLDEPKQAHIDGEAGKQLANENKGALARLIKIVSEHSQS